MTRIVVFSKTAGYRHDESIARGVELIRTESALLDVEVLHTEDSSVFAADSIKLFDAAVWLHVSGDVLADEERNAFGEYLQGGGGFAGIHGTADAEYGWSDYSQIVGARFLYHPQDQSQRASIRIENHEHASTVDLPEPWDWADEWYSFQENPRPHVNVLLRVDESTYDPQEHPMGEDHPLSWSGNYGAGRTWYTSLGHHPGTYSDRNFISHVWGGVRSVIPALD